MPLEKNTYHILPKLFAIYLRVVDYFRLLPRRVYRVFKYFFRGIWRSFGILFLEGLGNVLRNRPVQKIMYWTGEVVISFLELLGVGEIYETITDFSKPKTRPLHPSEIEMAKTIFGNSINYQRVRVDESAHLGPKQHHFCYVSFYIINSWGKMHDSTLIHELVHVWQYENMGAIYIPRALWAQTTPEGYDYGGVKMLLSFLSKNKTLYDFNLEQQGDIVADYFKIKNGYYPRWGNGTEEDLFIYERFFENHFS
ncbi:MAG TPA: hypothetical protein ENJ53_09095 [Phaeodactylibacter sp.]|nr:hypothetical protein [Phaeodactylibacter sp.]